jgi:hypothetical protein
MTDSASKWYPAVANAVSSPALLRKWCAGAPCETPARRATIAQRHTGNTALGDGAVNRLEQGGGQVAMVAGHGPS